MDTDTETKVALYGSLILRLPSLFFMDKILKLSFGLTAFYASPSNVQVPPSHYELPSIIDGSAPSDISDDTLYQHTIPSSNSSMGEIDNYSITEEFLPSLGSSTMNNVLKSFGMMIAFLCCKMVFALSWRHQCSLYSIIVSIICAISSFYCNIWMVSHFFTSSEVHEGPSVLRMLLTLDLYGIIRNSSQFLFVSICMVQTTLYIIFSLQFDNDDKFITNTLLTWAFLLPSISTLVSFSRDASIAVSVICASLIFLKVICRVTLGIPYIFDAAQKAFNVYQQMNTNFGLFGLIEFEWGRLQVPVVLRLYWILRTANIIVHSMAKQMSQQNVDSVMDMTDSHSHYAIFKDMMTLGCDTLIAVLGMTSVVSYISNYVGRLVQALLQTNDQERNMGTVSAIIFYLLAVQSGLTVLPYDKRYIRLCRNFSLLYTALLYFVHNMVNPVLMSLSASSNRCILKHIRALFVCTMLIILPLMVLYMLKAFFPFSTWALAVTAFSVQVIVKTTFSLITYALFLGDSYYSLFSQELDDYVYYIKVASNTFEFLLGIVLFFNGLYIFLFENGGAIRALMMCIHAYVNIWCEAKSGWTVYIKRREAVNKMANLADATRQQLDEHKDVCAICYQVLESAKVTVCKHIYHEICLRKWLYVQDSCPMCHSSVHSS